MTSEEDAMAKVLEPTVEQAAGFKTLDDVATFVGLSKEAHNQSRAAVRTAKATK